MSKIKKETSQLFESELQASSTKLTLQKLMKRAEENEAAIKAAKGFCPKCFKERSGCRCSKLGSGSGGGGAGNSTNESEKSYGLNHLPKQEQSIIKDTNKLAELELVEDSALLDLAAQRLVPEILAALIAKELKCKLNSFVEALKKEFQIFKEAHPEISDDCLKITQGTEGNILSLRITMPSLALYNEFIKRLANNLLPTLSPKIQAQDESREEQVFSLNPLSTKAKPSAKNKKLTQDEASQNEGIAHKKDEKEEEEQANFNPSPFSTSITPW